MAPPTCITLTVCPATASAALRLEAPVLLVTAKATLPLPVPDAPDVTVAQSALLAAVQLQPTGAVTVRAAPAWLALLKPWSVVGATAYVQATSLIWLSATSRRMRGLVSPLRGSVTAKPLAANAARPWLTVRRGTFCFSTAQAPATCGVAIEVP